MTTNPSHLSYLLRLWPVEVKSQIVWHASLTYIPNGKEKGFATLSQMVTYLENQVAQGRASIPSEDKPAPTALPQNDQNAS